jgi:hypothetical protein
MWRIRSSGCWVEDEIVRQSGECVDLAGWRMRESEGWKIQWSG